MKNLIIGEHSYCRNPKLMWEPKIVVEKYSAIASGTIFLGNANHPSIEHPNLVMNYPLANVPYGTNQNVDWPKCSGKGQIRIGNDVWIGYGCLIMSGVNICDGAIIGARSVVVSDIPPYAIAAGNPCRVRKFRFRQEEIQRLLKIKWWEWEDETIIKRLKDFKNIKKFIKKHYGKT